MPLFLPRTTSPDRPDSAGWVPNMKSGKASIIYKMGELGLGEPSDDQAADILNAVKAKGIDKRDVLSHEEFQTIVANVMG